MLEESIRLRKKEYSVRMRVSPYDFKIFEG